MLEILQEHIKQGNNVLKWSVCKLIERCKTVRLAPDSQVTIDIDIGSYMSCNVYTCKYKNNKIYSYRFMVTLNIISINTASAIA